jgi:hypothetical protein
MQVATNVRTFAPLALLIAALLFLPVGATALQHLPPFGDDWRDRAENLAEQYTMFGGFEMNGGQLSGAFVTMEISTTGSVSAFTLTKATGAVEVFASVRVETAVSAGTPSVEGSVFTFASNELAIEVHNNPAGVMIHRSLQGTVTVTYDLGAGVAAVREATSVYVAGQGLRGRIALVGTGSVAVTTAGIVVSIGPGSFAMFRAELVAGEGPVGPVLQPQIVDGVARGRIGAEAFVVALEGGVVVDAVSYAAIAMSLALVAPEELQVTVTATNLPGKVVAISVHKDVLAVANPADVVVELDGVPVPEALNAEAVLAAQGQAIQRLAFGPDGFVLLVSIPSFSTHVLSIKAVTEAIGFVLDTVGFGTVLAALALVAGAAAVALRRQRRAW